MVSVIAYTSMVNLGSIFENVLLIFFICSYSILLFTFSSMFSNVTKVKVQLASVGFGVVAIIVRLVSLIGSFGDAYTMYRTIAFFVLAAFCFIVVIFEQQKNATKTSRWYVAVQPPALFALLFVFFNVLYSGATQVWYPYVMDIFGFTFAILMILFIAPLFSWKSACIFAVLLTLIDIILVFTGPMVTAANTFTGLGIPSMVFLPNIPLVINEAGTFLFRGLGLGDFFFAGVLAVQTFNKFGKKTALVSIAAMSVAFGIWVLFLPDIKVLIDIGGFPATVCIISGWIPVAIYKWLTTKNKPQQFKKLHVEATNETNTPM